MHHILLKLCLIDGQSGYLQFASTTSNVPEDFLNHKPLCIGTFISAEEIP